MEKESPWKPYQHGVSIGAVGSEEGVIVQDDEHAVGARITLERRDGKAARFAITCGVYGWFFHTRYCSSKEEARQDFERMKRELDRIADLLSSEGASPEQTEHAVFAAISDFVDRYPT